MVLTNWSALSAALLCLLTVGTSRGHDRASKRAPNRGFEHGDYLTLSSAETKVWAGSLNQERKKEQLQQPSQSQRCVISDSFSNSEALRERHETKVPHEVKGPGALITTRIYVLYFLPAHLACFPTVSARNSSVFDTQLMEVLEVLLLLGVRSERTDMIRIFIDSVWPML